MKNAVFLYTTFIPTRILKWIVYLIYPAVLMMMSAAFGKFLIGHTLIIVPVIYVIEIVLNILMFKEIASNEPVRIEYMHTSDKGVGLFGDVMKVDAVRRLITVCAIMMVSGDWLHNITGAFMFLTVIEVEVWLARKLKGITVIFLLACAGYFLSVGTGFVTFYVPDRMAAVLLAVSIAVYITVIVLCYRNVMKSEVSKFSDSTGKE
jgi:hypothetical protein